MKAKFLTILFVAISMFFIACDEDSITEAVLGTGSVTLTGDITNSFDAQSVAGLGQEDTTSFFVVAMRPEGSSVDESNDVLNLMKVSDVLPAVGQYEIGEDIANGENFMATYVADDSTFYFMHTGTIEITESSATKIAGIFDVSGYYFDFPIDSTRILNVKGEFSSIPADLD